MGDWMRGSITGDLTEVPGIGPSAAKKLAEGDTEGECITNTFQLIGKVRYNTYLIIFFCQCNAWTL